MEYHLYLVGFYKLQARYGLLQRPFCPTAGPLIHKPWGCGPSYRLDSSHIQFPNLHDKLRELVDHILYDSSLPNWSREASPQLKICLIRMNIFFIILININSRHGKYCFNLSLILTCVRTVAFLNMKNALYYIFLFHVLNKLAHRPEPFGLCINNSTNWKATLSTWVVLPGLHWPSIGNRSVIMLFTALHFLKSPLKSSIIIVAI